ncbi:MAG: heme exporter protein CcmB [Armatimonadetes bacterium]|nr:heme exporter protein CcmB [Armatimonadota bacterium]
MLRTNSTWTHEIGAVVRKEFRTELRSKSATYTSFMLSGVTVFTLAFAFYGRELTSEAAAGMLWAALLFAGVGTLTRAFVAEEEQGTGDLLRMWARPHAVYWGKFLFAAAQMALTAAMVALLFLMLTGVGVKELPMLAATLLGGSIALAGMVTLVSALISRGNNRSTLAGVVALPLLVPLVALGVSALRNALDGFSISTGWMGCLGVWLYTIVVLAGAPFQFAAVWGEI